MTNMDERDHIEPYRQTTLNAARSASRVCVSHPPSDRPSHQPDLFPLLGYGVWRCDRCGALRPVSAQPSSNPTLKTREKMTCYGRCGSDSSDLYQSHHNVGEWPPDSIAYECLSCGRSTQLVGTEVPSQEHLWPPLCPRCSSRRDWDTAPTPVIPVTGHIPEGSDEVLDVSKQFNELRRLLFVSDCICRTLIEEGWITPQAVAAADEMELDSALHSHGVDACDIIAKAISAVTRRQIISLGVSLSSDEQRHS